MALTEQTCTPCKGGIEPLSVEDARKQLSQVPAWRLIHGSRALWRKFTVKNFAAAQALCNGIGVIAEQEGHHPDLSYGWGYVEVEIKTHKISGLHENDFILAAKIDRLWQQWQHSPKQTV